jgi:hypothetical protein
MNRLAGNSRKPTAGARAPSGVVAVYGTFAAQRLAGSKWTQKTFDRMFKELSIDVQLDKIQLKLTGDFIYQNK